MTTRSLTALATVLICALSRWCAAQAGLSDSYSYRLFDQEQRGGGDPALISPPAAPPTWLAQPWKAPTRESRTAEGLAPANESLTPPPPGERPPAAMPYDQNFAVAPLPPPAAGSRPGDSRYRGLPEVRRWDRFNLTLELPSYDWVEMPNAESHEVGGVVLMRRNPDLLIVVACERIGLESYITAHNMLAAHQAQFREKKPDAKFTPAERENLSGIAGLRYDISTINDHGDEAFGSAWVGVHNGISYYVLVIGRAENEAETKAARRDMCLRMRLIDGSRIAHSTRGQEVTTFESPRFGYRINLTEMGWSQTEELQAKFQAFDFGATRGVAGVTVLPIPLPNRQPDLDLIAKLLMMRINPTAVEKGGIIPTQAKVGDLPARQYILVGGEKSLPMQFVFRVAANHNFAYCVMGFSLSGDPEGEAELFKAMDRVTIIPNFLPKSLHLSDKERAKYGVVLNELGMAEQGRNHYDAAIDYYQGAHALFPTDEAILLNQLSLFYTINRKPDALALVKQELPRFPGSEALRAIHAKLLAETGNPAEARKEYRQLFLDGATDEDILSAYLELAFDARAFDEAIEVTRAVVARKPSVKMWSLLASIYAKKGDFDTAISQLQDLRRENPQDVDIKILLAFTYERAEKYDAALKITQAEIDAGSRDETIWILHGRNQLNLEQFAEAKQTAERAIELNPNSETLKELLQASSNVLGQGENSPLKKSIDPVEFPEIIRQQIASAKVRPAQALEKYGAEELVRITAISYHRDKPLKKTISCRIKVHTAGGVAQYSTLTFPLSKMSEQLFVNRLVVLDAGGKQVAEGNVDNYYITDDTSSGLATNDQIVNIPVPGLKPGHTIEYMVTRESRGADDEFPFEELKIAADVPTSVSAFFVEGDVDGLRCASSVPLPIIKTGNVLHCVVANPTPYRTEARQQSPNRFMPIVWIGDAKATWESEAQRYLKMIAEKSTLDEPTRATAIDLTKDCHNKREKLAALAAYVQGSFTYQGIEFGRRGRVPNHSGKTIELQYGDCKDHALLLQQLLSAVGIPSSLATVNSSAEIAPQVPSLDQFDHMVLFVPNESLGEAANATGGLVVDVTAKESDPLLYPPYGLSGKHVLVLDEKRPRLVETPAYPLDALQMNCQRRVTVNESSASSTNVDVRVVEDLTFNGYLSPAIRSYLHSYEAGERRAAIQQVLGANQHVRVDRADIENLDVTSKPLTMHLEYSLPDAFHRLPSHGGATLVGTLPSAWETYFLEAEYLETRETPFEVKTPRLIRTSLTVELPAGYSAADFEPRNSAKQTPFVAWATNSRIAGKSFVVEHVVRVPGGRHAARDYAAYYADMKNSLAPLQTPVLCRERTLTAARPDGVTESTMTR
jgi:tetratricopeptide (TPR) repeat protein